VATARNQEKDFGKNGFASDKRFVKGCKLVLDPLVVKVSTIQERHNRSRINENATRHIPSSEPCWSKDLRDQKLSLSKAASHPAVKWIYYQQH